MKNQKKAAPTRSGIPQSSNGNNSKYNRGKLDFIFRYFSKGNRLNRFQAETLGDHCLPTSVAGLQTAHGVYFDRKRVKVKNRFGTKTNVAEYWLEGENLARARKIVAQEVGV